MNCNENCKITVVIFSFSVIAGVLECYSIKSTFTGWDPICQVLLPETSCYLHALLLHALLITMHVYNAQAMQCNETAACPTAHATCTDRYEKESFLAGHLQESMKR